MTGLLTFTHADNYGALLQAYALQQTLKRSGHENVFLNLVPPKTEPERNLSALPPLMRKKIEETLKYYRIRAGRFEDFRKNFLSVTEPVSPSDAPALNKKFERFIVGSDQVWNDGATGGNLIYTLPFAEPEKRFSYAASFGGAEGVEKATERFWQELSQFRKISLRENDGAASCLEKTGIAPQIHVDPCLLRSEEEWLSFIRNTEKMKEEFVFLFLIEYDAAFYRLAEQFAQFHNLPLKIVTASYIPQFGFESFAGTGVKEWLGLIRDARYIFCDSFHACVFSLLFEKNFMPNLSRQKLAGRSSRLSKLLENFGLETDKMNENGDWGTIKEKILIEKTKALCYLEAIYE